MAKLQDLEVPRSRILSIAFWAYLYGSWRSPVNFLYLSVLTFLKDITLLAGSRNTWAELTRRWAFWFWGFLLYLLVSLMWKNSMREYEERAYIFSWVILCYNLNNYSAWKCHNFRCPCQAILCPDSKRLFFLLWISEPSWWAQFFCASATSGMDSSTTLPGSSGTGEFMVGKEFSSRTSCNEIFFLLVYHSFIPNSSSLFLQSIFS